jgi:hypothetical protein
MTLERLEMSHGPGRAGNHDTLLTGEARSARHDTSSPAQTALTMHGSHQLLWV